jgi:hypothetical protein
VDNYKHFMDQVLIIARAADALAIRVTQLEKLVQYPNTAKQETLKSQAAQATATNYEYYNEHLYAPLRSDTAPLIRLAAFARRLLDPSDLGHAVTEEVRNLAREALGK